MDSRKGWGNCEEQSRISLAEWMIRIPKNERFIVWRLFAYSLGIATSYIVARTIADSLFLGRIGKEHLALVFVLAGCCTAATAAIWYLSTRTLRVAQVIQLSSLIFALLTFAAWFYLPSMQGSFWLLAGIYMLAEVKGCINAINLISALNTKLGREASKSSWAAVGIAVPIAAVATGTLLAIESQVIDLRTWLLFTVGLDLFTLVIGFSLGKTPTLKAIARDEHLGPIGQPANLDASIEHAVEPKAGLIGKLTARYVCINKFQQWIGILIAAKVIALTIIAFEWKFAASRFFGDDSEQLVRFFGIYYGCVGLATILCQYLLTARLLYSRNFRTPLLLMPMALMLVAVLLLFSPASLLMLIATTGGKAMDVWRRSVHDTTLNLLYTKIKRGQRRFAISINSGLLKPIAEVVAASLIFFGSYQLYRPMLVVVLVIWIIAAWSLIRLVSHSKNKAGMDAPLSTEETKAQDDSMIQNTPTA